MVFDIKIIAEFYENPMRKRGKNFKEENIKGKIYENVQNIKGKDIGRHIVHKGNEKDIGECIVHKRNEKKI